jgi:two-component system chemotaxis response regulator CheB
LKKLLKKQIVSGQHNQEIQENTIYVAPANCHMEVCPRSNFPYRIILTDGPPENFCKPSVDPMFRSIARRFRHNAMGIVLTGIGQDGLIGATEIIKNGGTVLAQNKETSVVWGMPKSIVENGLASIALSPKQLGDYVTSLFFKGTLL